MNRNEEWKRLIDELEDSVDRMARSFAYTGTVASEGVEEGIRKGYCAFHNRRTIVEALEKHAVVKKWDEIATYAMLATSPTGEHRQMLSQAAAFSRRTMEFLLALRRAALDDSLATRPSGGRRPLI
jgi:hypothetical protein